MRRATPRCLFFPQKHPALLLLILLYTVCTEMSSVRHDISAVPVSFRAFCRMERRRYSVTRRSKDDWFREKTPPSCLLPAARCLEHITPQEGAPAPCMTRYWVKVPNGSRSRLASPGSGLMRRKPPRRRAARCRLRSAHRSPRSHCPRAPPSLPCRARGSQRHTCIPR